jgi:DNA repair protein RecO (recombination protein O)
MILTTEALVLRTMKYSETSLIATMFTRDHGKISVLAKGARRKNRPFGSSIEAMNHVRAIIYHKPQRELQLLTQCDLVSRQPAIVDDLDRMGIGMSAVELLHLATEHDEPHPEVFDLTLELFCSLQAAALKTATLRLENALYAYEVRLLGLLGFKPSLRQCVSCKEEISPFPVARQKNLRRMTGNGVLCARCGSMGHSGVAISPNACAALESFQSTGGIADALRVTVSPEESRDIHDALQHLVQVHLTGMRPLRSEQVFSRMR